MVHNLAVDQTIRVDIELRSDLTPRPSVVLSGGVAWVVDMFGTGLKWVLAYDKNQPVPAPPMAGLYFTVGTIVLALVLFGIFGPTWLAMLATGLVIVAAVSLIIVIWRSRHPKLLRPTDYR